GEWQGEIWNRHKNGYAYPEWLTISAVRDEQNRVTNYVGIFVDITSRKQAEERLRHMATHDPLTGLWNRRAILNRLEEVCRSSAPSQGRQPLGLIIIDLDDFKGVNDALGHISGDIVLRAAARQIEAQTRQGDAVGRYGGDEFLVILPGADREALESVVQRIAGTNYDIPVEGRSVIITASCGALAVSGESVPNAMALLAQADGLLIRSKKSGKHSYLIGTLAGRSADRHSA
ncbi:MAG: diguanylate cyclase, partial [Candidatus Aminicenantes bacterium]|nr:diguanylate cyclase [Candidatus Aminicenantes bacterium]